jgi:hypothetical protein
VLTFEHKAHLPDDQDLSDDAEKGYDDETRVFNKEIKFSEEFSNSQYTRSVLSYQRV